MPSDATPETEPGIGRASREEIEPFMTGGGC